MSDIDVRGIRAGLTGLGTARRDRLVEGAQVISTGRARTLGAAREVLEAR